MLRFTSLRNATSELISEKEYTKVKAPLLKRKNAFESDVASQGKEIEKWVELSEKTFDFARYAKIWFEKGDNIIKRYILACLCSHLILKDQRINVLLHPFFIEA